MTLRLAALVVAVSVPLTALELARSSVSAGQSHAYAQQLTALGPRLTGTAGYERAAEWSAAQLRAMGLARVALEPFTIERGWERVSARARLVAPEDRQLHVTSLGWMPSTAGGGVEGEIVALEPFALDAIPEPRALRGRIVLLPAAQLGRDDEHVIRGWLARGPVRLSLELINRITPGAVAVDNVIADLPGRERGSECVVVGAHLDSWDFGPGAQDNATGVAMVLEAARAIAAFKTPPRRAIRFALWGGEEQGQLGAGTFDDSLRYAFQPDGAPFILAGIPTLDLNADDTAYEEIHHKAADTMARVDARALAAGAAVTTEGDAAMTRWLMAAAMCLCAVPVLAQDKDADGSKDHPMFSRMPGYYIEDYDAQDFSLLELETDPPRNVEGRYWKISYWLKEGARKAGPVQIARNYTDLMLKRGGRKLFDDVDAGGGTAIAQMPAAGENLYLQIKINNNGEVYDLYVVEEAAMEQKVEFTAMELARALNDKGSVALHNILFDTGQATLKPESAAALAPVGELLKSDAALALEIQGHTDNVGQAAANLKLSQDRAAAVKAYLVQTFGIPAARLTTSGFGDTKPVAPNTAEAGRAQNRRVELVKK